MPESAAQRAVEPADDQPALVPTPGPTLIPTPGPALAPAPVGAPGLAAEPAEGESGPHSSADAGPVRLRTPEEIVQGWQAALASSGKPDTLLRGADTETSWLDLSHAHPSGVAQLMAGRPTRLSSLVREREAHSAARRRARSIRVVAGELAAERGVRAGYLAAGVATWRPGRVRGVVDLDAPMGPVRAPILLRACTLRPRDAGHEDYDIDLDGTPVVNPELLRRLAEEHGIELSGDALAGLSFGRNGFDPEPVYRRLQERCADIPGFKIERVLAVAALTAGSGAVMADLADASPAIVVHPLLGRVTREEAAAEVRTTPYPAWEAPATGGLQVDPDPRSELLPLDLDLAQHRAVDAAVAGEHVALEGPPGSGLTHTLAAIAATLAAQGRRCLVVTPRRASADAFIARLAAAGLADLVLDLQDGVGDRTSIHETLFHALEGTLSGQALAATDPRPNFEEQLNATLRDSRAQLEASVAALHEVREPWGVSAYTAMSTLADLMARPPAPRTTVRLSRGVLARLDDGERDRLRGVIREAGKCSAFTSGIRDTPWFDAKVSSSAAARAAMEEARAAGDGLGRARRDMTALAAAAGLTPATTASGWRPQLDLLLGVRATLDRLTPAVFEHPVDDLLAALTPDGGDNGMLARRALRRRARSFVRPGVHVPDLRGALAKAAVERGLWQRMSSGGRPRVPTGLADAQAAVESVTAALAALDGVLAPAVAAVRPVQQPLTPPAAAQPPAAAMPPGATQPPAISEQLAISGGTASAGLAGLPLEWLERLLSALVDDEAGLREQPRRTVLLTELRQAGLDALVSDLRARRLSGDAAAAELDLAWWAGVLEAVVAADPRLAGHDGRTLRRAGAHFRLADCAHVREGARHVRRRVTLAAERFCAEHPDQVRWLQAEVVRGHRSRWPEDMLAQAHDVVAALKPVWVMSPDAVARLLPPARLEPVVDAVLVDDAGHVALPEVAAAMARGAQVIVAGDRRRLLPQAGMTSVLDAVAPVIGVHRLDRDHRTLDGRMLAPLLACYPEGWQVTPGTSVAPRLRLENVVDGSGVPGPGEEVPVSPDGEVRRVVDLVAEHARRRPEDSLMVVTFGARHAERIEDELRTRVTEDAALADWLDHWWTQPVAEPFLVQPVHRVLGIERDEAIVAVGIGSTPHGRVLHRFGVLDEPVGEAVLLTALSRARRRVVIACSFDAERLDPSRLHSRGSRLLYSVLLAAGQDRRGGTPVELLGRSGGAAAMSQATGEPQATDAPQAPALPDPLVADLADRLRAVDLPVTTGFGDPAWPLDLAIGDPRVAGRQIMAVDVDGPRFAEAASVRDRERHRRERFERAGWTYCKVAAMDLFLNPDAEVARLRDLWEAALGEVVTASIPTVGS